MKQRHDTLPQLLTIRIKLEPAKLSKKKIQTVAEARKISLKELLCGFRRELIY